MGIVVAKEVLAELLYCMYVLFDRYITCLPTVVNVSFRMEATYQMLPRFCPENSVVEMVTGSLYIDSET